MHGGAIHRIAEGLVKAEGHYTVSLGRGGGCSYPPMIETNNCWNIINVATAYIIRVTAT